MNGTFVADLFSGCGGVAKAVRVLGFDGREWEIALGPDGDICNRKVRRKLLQAIRSGRAIAIMAAPPCGIFPVRGTALGQFAAAASRGDCQTFCSTTLPKSVMAIDV